ncbi:sensor domain-containing diguanylate cyclase [Marinicellulosiphila megalodicopiae]|uniref:sensor domain-containing diguanylate cyclase n=1 Tax=Marinicellulosiphila megalodicopiae TaxID=2724896 RepID=UPI003BB193C8
MENIPSIIQAMLLDNILNTNDAIAVFGPNDAILFSNKTFAGLYDLSVNEVNGKLWQDCVKHSYINETGLKYDTDNIENWLHKANKLRRSEIQRTFEINTLKDRWYLCNETTNEQGYIVFHGIENTRSKQLEIELKNTTEKLTLLATTDPLTNLYNRRFFFMRLKDEINRYQRTDKFISVIMLDLDHFKQINDQYGHKGGDEVLVTFAKLIKKLIRPYDLAARMGGEEFAIILPNTNMHEGQMIAERIRQSLAKLTFKQISPDLKVTISIGGMTSNSELNASKFTLKSDNALYKAKNNGRNQVVWCK